MALLILLISLLAPFPTASAWSFIAEEKLTARAAFLMEAVTGRVLYQREPDLTLPPASTTKIMTAVVALESEWRENDLLRVTKTATQVPSSKLHLRAGQAMTVEDLLYSVLLSSANDASIVLAEGIAGSVQRFSEMMTLKAREIGALNTQFRNPHGLSAPGHYSTARDMALMFNYAMRIPKFREIVQTKTASVSSISYSGKTKKTRRLSLRNHNRLLWSFDGAIGGKTGYTYAAQRCFVGAVSRDGATLIVSILGSRDLWGDTVRLLEYGLRSYQPPDLVTAAAPQPYSAEPDPARPVVTYQERPASPLFSWEEEKIVRAAEAYVLQIASFRERERAESLMETILEAGFDAYLEEASLDGGETTHRVRTGPYTDLVHAQEAAQEIETKSGFRAIILPISLSAESGAGPD